MSKILEVKELSVAYGSEEIFSNISFSVNRGDYIGIVGPNGAGKTTLIKAVAGILPYKNGAINYSGSGKNISEAIGYIPQKVMIGDRIFPATVEEIILSGLLVKKKFPRYYNKSDKEKVKVLGEKLNFGDILKERFGNLSGGQQQKVLLARALISEPEILFLDEPISALDVNARENFYAIIKELNVSRKITILFISHDIATVGKYTNKMLYIDRKLVFYGDYEEFCSSGEMTKYFGFNSQHQICWRHKDGKCN